MSIRLPYKRILSHDDSTRNWEALGKYLGSGTTANRPNAALIDLGAMYFDTTLGQPIWSDGTIWVDATGAAA